MKKNRTSLYRESFIPIRKYLRIMKLTFILILLGLMSFASVTYSQATRLTFESKNSTIESIFKQIESLSEFKFAYNSTKLDVDKKISIKVDNQTIDAILDKILGSANFQYQIVDRYIIITDENGNDLNSSSLEQSARKITGKVSDSSGNPLPGVTIVIKGTTTGSITDINGNYLVPNVPENATLQFSFVGMKTQELPASGKSVINVTMQDETIGIEEVVAVGYGKQSRARITGAISDIGSKELKGRQVRVASQALQGQVPGLVIATTSGQPGSEGINMKIRGMNSWGTNSTPLILIDGVPGDMDNLDPDIIEHVTVLKDASSAAIYGARAANGVILVTTKRGSTNKIQISYNSVFSTQSPTMKFRSIQDPVEYMNLYNTALKNTLGAGTKDFYTADDIAKFQDGTFKGTNWNDYIFKTNLVQEHRLNLSGGTENVKFSTGISYLDQPGIVKHFDYNRFTYFGNFDLTASKFISAGGQMSFTRGNMEEPGQTPIRTMLLSMVTRPTANPTYVDPVSGQTKYMNGRWNKESLWGSLPAFLDGSGTRTNMTDILNLQAYIKVTPIEGLEWETKIATFYTHNYDKLTVYDEDAWSQVENVRVSTYNPANMSLRINQPWNQLNTLYSTLTYTKSIADKHSFNLMAGYEFDDNKNQSMDAYRLGFPSKDLQELNAGSTASWTNGGTSSEWAIQSFFGRLHYDFNEKYLVDGTIRNDQSSRFKKGFKAAVFPSVGLGWLISKENFMKNIPWISNMKLRASWGKLGNQDIGNYPYQSTYNLGTSSSYWFGGISTGAVPGPLVNENLSWETTTVKNIGFDLDIKKGLFSLSAEYYNKLTSDILRGAQVMGAVGLSAPTINNGELQNMGVELVLGHKKQINDRLNYWVNANIGINKNKVVSFGKNEIGNNSIIMEGEEYRAWYLLQMTGIYQENDPDLQKLKVDGKTQRPGQIKYEDVNGDGNITSADRQVVGHKFPETTFGINLGAQYGNFDFSAFIYGVEGFDGYQQYHGYEPFAQLAESPNVAWKNAWTPENKSNSWPQIYVVDAAGGNWYNSHPSTFFLQDLSYIRLKNIQIGYNFPASLLRSTPVSSARIYFSGENLLSVYNNKNSFVDPETAQDGSWSNYQYPQLKTYSFGLTVKF